MVGGHCDHVHCLFVLDKTESISGAVSRIKSNSSRWLTNKLDYMRDFAWQPGYAAFSIGRTEVEMIRQYIANQERHHRKVTFQDELRTLCAEYGVDLDERYAWVD